MIQPVHQSNLFFRINWQVKNLGSLLSLNFIYYVLSLNILRELEHFPKDKTEFFAIVPQALLESFLLMSS